MKRRNRNRRKKNAVGTVVIAGMALLTAIFMAVLPQQESENLTVTTADKEGEISSSGMEVHFIDVGQSDSTLIISGGHAMLIDAGDNSQGTAIQLYLQKQGIDSLDYLVLTHTDADHIGGADVIITKFDVDMVFMGNYEKDNATYRDVIQALDEKGLSFSTPQAGSVYALGAADFTIIAPVGSYSDPNNSSIGLLLENGETRFLFTGDAEETAEADIVEYCAEAGVDITADVYQAGHHGSSTSSSQALLDAVMPSYAVISCGQDNSYGFPHAEVLNSFRERGIQVFRTDEQGSIIAASDGEHISWNCAPSETWQTGTKTQSASGQEKQTAEAMQADAEPVEDILPEATKKPSESAAVSAAPESVLESTEITYICNTNTMKFHLPSCSSVKDISEKNKLETSESREAIMAQGYVPCGRCNP